MEAGECSALPNPRKAHSLLCPLRFQTDKFTLQPAKDLGKTGKQGYKGLCAVPYVVAWSSTCVSRK